MSVKIFEINYADPNAWSGADEIDYRELDREVSLGPVEIHVYDPEEKGYRGKAGHFHFPAGLNSPAGYKVTVRNMEKRPILFHGTRENQLPDEGAQSWTDDRTEGIDWWVINESPVIEFDGGFLFFAFEFHGIHMPGRATIGHFWIGDGRDFGDGPGLDLVDVARQLIIAAVHRDNVAGFQG